MLTYKIIMLVLLGCMSLSGCSSINLLGQQNQSQAPVSNFQTGRFGDLTKQSGAEKGIEPYARDVMAQMANTMVGVDSDSRIVVTHFSDVNSDLQSTSALGLALGESFQKVLHEFGFKTVDYVLTDSIRVTERGNFAYSRDFLNLVSNVTSDYVLVGTFTQHRGGVTVNARIVDVASKDIVSVGSSFIPQRQINLLVNMPHTPHGEKEISE
ncbi:FlgO family outer membrane protein [Alteromonas facilis]|uniref:FlgO family outer membrane protein n=1 Tax=Alteromonas facilis TaxID=2048004 RepID=UPI000C285C7F|nr:FlgO family outer membrane protein [Alteromonas facilis]